MTDRGPRQYRFPALTGIRFPLALWVVSYHLTHPGNLWEGVTAAPVIEVLASHAYVALGTFFALSGFLLTQGYQHSEWTRRAMARYFIARIARIYPLYLFSLLIIAPILYHQLRDSALGAPGHRAAILARQLALLQSWSPAAVFWNTPAWSLSCELFFYACFPFLLRGFNGRPGKRTVLLTVGAICIPLLVHALGVPTTMKPLVYFGDFLAGMAAASIFDLLSRGASWIARRGDVLYLPAIAVGLSLLFVDRALNNWLLFDTALRLANGACVLGLALGGGPLGRLLGSRLMVFGGNISYAIYILHVPLLWWYRRWFAVLFASPVIAGFVYFACVLAVAATAYRWVELPGNNVFRSAFAKRSPEPGPISRTTYCSRRNTQLRSCITRSETSA